MILYLSGVIVAFIFMLILFWKNMTMLNISITILFSFLSWIAVVIFVIDIIVFEIVDSNSKKDLKNNKDENNSRMC